MAVAYLENPVIRCERQLYNKAADCKYISLAVKKNDSIQKFSLSFSNLSEHVLANLDFQIM